MSKSDDFLPVVFTPPTGVLEKFFPSKFKRQIQQAEFVRRQIIIDRVLKKEKLGADTDLKQHEQNAQTQLELNRYKNELADKIGKQVAAGEAVMTSAINFQEIMGQLHLVHSPFDRQIVESRLRHVFHLHNGIVPDEEDKEE